MEEKDKLILNYNEEEVLEKIKSDFSNKKYYYLGVDEEKEKTILKYFETAKFTLKELIYMSTIEASSQKELFSAFEIPTQNRKDIFIVKEIIKSIVLPAINIKLNSSIKLIFYQLPLDLSFTIGSMCTQLKEQLNMVSSEFLI